MVTYQNVEQPADRSMPSVAGSHDEVAGELPTQASAGQAIDLVAAEPAASGTGDYQLVVSRQALGGPDLSVDAGRNYLTGLDFSPEDARYWDLVNGALPLNSAESELLARNGFVASESYQWQQFSDAYAWIYWQDLPVMITTDSILHALHQSYSDMLEDIEKTVLRPQLHNLLKETKTDRVDAELIARFVAKIRPQPRAVMSEGCV